MNKLTCFFPVKVEANPEGGRVKHVDASGDFLLSLFSPVLPGGVHHIDAYLGVAVIRRDLAGKLEYLMGSHVKGVPMIVLIVEVSGCIPGDGDHFVRAGFECSMGC